MRLLVVVGMGSPDDGYKVENGMLLGKLMKQRGDWLRWRDKLPTVHGGAGWDGTGAG